MGTVDLLHVEHLGIMTLTVSVTICVRAHSHGYMTKNMPKAKHKLRIISQKAPN